MIRGQGQANGTHTFVVPANVTCGWKTSLLMDFHPMAQVIALSSSVLNVVKTLSETHPSTPSSQPTIQTSLYDNHARDEHDCYESINHLTINTYNTNSYTMNLTGSAGAFVCAVIRSTEMIR